MSDIKNRVFTDDEKQRIKNIISEGVKTKTEIDALREGLKDAVKSVGESLDIKPKLINAAINSAFKNDLETKKEAVNDLEEILVMTKIAASSDD